MFCLRFLPFLLLAVAAFLLVGWSTSRHEAGPPSEPTVPLPPARPDADAVRLLDAAARALDPQQVKWVETTVWQKVTLADFAYQAEGRYRAGPDHRFRLELRTRQGDTEGLLRVVSDGRVIRQEVWIDNKLSESSVTEEQTPALARPAGDELARNPLAGGVAALVDSLRQQMVWVARQTVRRGDRPYHRLTGVWPGASPPAEARTPRLARLYLEPQTLWPHRLEWWGLDPPRAGDVLLMQTEFRDRQMSRDRQGAAEQTAP
jgi:hypothetical protein